MKFKHICFDLDGTLVDSSITIYKSTIAALDKLRINYNIVEDEFTKMIGLHFIDIFNRFNISVTDFEEFIKIYKTYYFTFINESNLYPYAKDLLEKINGNGLKTSLLTTKGQDQAEKIVNHFELNEDLNYIMGRRNGIEHKPSAEPLLKICKELKVQPCETLMVGDTEMDIRCGKNAGAKTCAVLFGYRTKEQIEKEKPDYVLSSLNELAEII